MHLNFGLAGTNSSPAGAFAGIAALDIRGLAQGQGGSGVGFYFTHNSSPGLKIDANLNWLKIKLFFGLVTPSSTFSTAYSF